MKIYKFRYNCDSDFEYTNGNIYSGYVKSEDTFCIENDNGGLNLYSVEPDEDGLSYKNWFEIVL